jgi:hypothetical protein
MERLRKLELQLTKNDIKVMEGNNFLKITDNRTGTSNFIQANLMMLPSKIPKMLILSMPKISRKSQVMINRH